MIYKWITIVSLWLLYYTCRGQEVIFTDTVYTPDSLLIQDKEIVVIKKKEALAVGIFTECTFNSGFLISNNNTFSHSPLYGFELNQNLMVNNYILESGISIYKTDSRSTFFYEEYEYFSYTNHITDTLNIHYEHYGNDSVPVVITEEYDLLINDTTIQAYKTELSQHVQLMSIPINFGYRIKTPTLAYHIKAGIQLQWVSKVSGQLVDPVTNSVQNIEYQRVNSTNISWHLSLGIEYPLSNHWSVLAEPYFYRRSKNILYSYVTENRPVNVVGIRLGLQFWY